MLEEKRTIETAVLAGLSADVFDEDEKATEQTLDELAASLAEKRQTVMARRKLIIETAYGRREFSLEEVRRAVVAEGQRQEDVLELLKEVTL